MDSDTYRADREDQTPPTSDVLHAWWRLRNIRGVGSIALGDVRAFLNHAPSQLTYCTPEDLRAAGLNASACDQFFNDDSLSEDFDKALNWCQHPDQGLLLAGCSPYPGALASLRDAPTMLWYRGNLTALQRPMIAIVGSRGATPAALEWARDTAAFLATRGITVVSGLALGIDGAAHTGAISVTRGSTIAVMGTGADIIYPARHRHLARDITPDGLLLTEFAPGTKAQARHFPSRNRIISGLSMATLVVEAGLQSGTMITARMAADHGRDVLAVPGALGNPLSRGPHQLIREGALLVENGQQVLEALQLDSVPLTRQASLFDEQPKTEAAPELSKTPDIPEIASLVDFSPTAVDVIALRAACPVSELLPKLLQLELDGWLTQVPGGYSRLR
ncbi:MAG: DNA-processing protein DprA [Thalassolituus sp.]